MANVIRAKFLKSVLWYADRFNDDLSNFVRDREIHEKTEGPFSLDAELKLQIFYTDLLDVQRNLAKLNPLLGMENFALTDLSSEQRVLLQNFTSFLLRFWSHGLKVLVTSSDMRLMTSFRPMLYSWSFLLELWRFDVPFWLSELQPLLRIPTCRTNLIDAMLRELANYLSADPSTRYVFEWSGVYQDSKSIPTLPCHLRSDVMPRFLYLGFKYRYEVAHKIDADLLFYLIHLLKESHKNFTFDIKDKVFKKEYGEEPGLHGEFEKDE